MQITTATTTTITTTVTTAEERIAIAPAASFVGRSRRRRRHHLREWAIKIYRSQRKPKEIPPLSPRLPSLPLNTSEQAITTNRSPPKKKQQNTR